MIVDFQSLQVRAIRASILWPKVALRRASVNSFGFGGSNAHVVLDEAKSLAKPTHVSSFKNSEELDDFFAQDDDASDKLCLLACSANDEGSLLRNVEALRKHLLYPAVQIELQDLAFTLSERRTHHLHRGFIVTDKAIFDPRAMVMGKKSAERPRSGQGSALSSQGRELNGPVWASY